MTDPRATSAAEDAAARDTAEQDAETQEGLVQTRAELTAEEKTAGSDDPEAQAAAILAESDERARDRERAPTTAGERRTSDETVAP